MDINSFNLQQSYFELFGLPVGCPVQLTDLRATYMELQRAYHPDKYAAADDSDRLRAVQVASFVNEAHKTLASPLKCAEYCLQLQGASTDSDTDAKMDPMFLMQQMEWRESLEEIAPDSSESYQALEVLRGELKQKINEVSAETARALDAQHLDLARDAVRKWQFLEKLVAETIAVEATLDENLH